MEIQRTTVMPASSDEVRSALSDPELLSAWLGPWTEQHDGTAIVVTDDGIARRVSGRRANADGSIRWTWAPIGSPEDSSDVELRLDIVDDEHTQLTVREAPSVPAAAASTPTDVLCLAGSSERWTACLLALGSLLSARVTVAV